MKQEYMNQHINWKKIWLLYKDRVWLIVVLAMAAAGMAAGIYQVGRALLQDGPDYRVSSDYYLYFNAEDYPDGVDYYNAYTWDTILRDDPLVNAALEVLPEDYTEEEIRASVTGEMLGDYRILTVYATHQVPERAEAIAQAYLHALETFPERIDIFDHIELWSQEDCEPVKERDLSPNIALIAGVISIFLAGFGWAIGYVLDDSIYVEKDYTSRFEGTFFGTMTEKESDLCKQEIRDNMEFLLPETSDYYLVFMTMKNHTDKYTKKEKQEEILKRVQSLSSKVSGRLALQGKELELLRKSSGAILMIPWGKRNGNEIEKTLAFLKKQNCNPAGVIVYDADERFLKKYYHIS